MIKALSMHNLSGIFGGGVPECPGIYKLTSHDTCGGNPGSWNRYYMIYTDPTSEAVNLLCSGDLFPRELPGNTSASCGCGYSAYLWGTNESVPSTGKMFWQNC